MRTFQIATFDQRRQIIDIRLQGVIGPIWDFGGRAGVAAAVDQNAEMLGQRRDLTVPGPKVRNLAMHKDQRCARALLETSKPGSVDRDTPGPSEPVIHAETSRTSTRSLPVTIMSIGMSNGCGKMVGKAAIGRPTPTTFGRLAIAASVRS